jgi:hypothetical protein
MIGMLVKKKRGSSSIMVILIMLTLVVFGVLALMSSYSDLKLSKKNASWLEKYYSLDAKGEDLLSQIDSRLIAAAKKARIGAVLDKEKYLSLAQAEINAMKTEDKLKLTKNNNMLIISSDLFDKEKNKLGISLEVEPALITGQNQGGKYYKVIKWTQIPKDFKYDNTIQLWNGEVN